MSAGMMHGGVLIPGILRLGLMWFALALTAAALFGVGQVFAKQALARTSPAANNLLLAALAVAVDVPLAIHAGLSPSGFVAVLPLAAFVAATYQVYYYALSRGQVSLTGTLMACYPVVTSALSVALLGEHVGVSQGLGVGFTILGAAMLSLGERPSEGKGDRTWIAWGVAGAVSLGAGDFAAKVATGNAGVLPFAGTTAICLLPLCMAVYLLDPGARSRTNGSTRGLLAIGFAAVTLHGGILALYFALASGPASLVSPVSSGYVGITALLALVFLGERLTRQQLLGIVLVLCGIGLVGIG